MNLLWKSKVICFQTSCFLGTNAEGNAGLMMKTSWKFGLHVHNYMSTGQRVPVGQRNLLRRETWESNPLEGYRIPVSAVPGLSALSKTLTGPRAKACQAKRQSDGEPHTMVHWTLALTHALPLRCTLRGPTIAATQPRCTPQYADLLRSFGVNTHTCARTRCGNKGSIQMKIFSVVSQGLWLLPFLQENSLKSQNLRGPGIFNFQGHSWKGKQSLTDKTPLDLHQIMP